MNKRGQCEGGGGGGGTERGERKRGGGGGSVWETQMGQRDGQNNDERERDRVEGAESEVSTSLLISISEKSGDLKQ